MLSRIAGFFSGMGGSFVAIALVVLLRRRLLGEARAKDSELAATDERGQLIALKAQNVLALCVTFSMCAMIIVAMVRGDTLYILLGAALLMLSAAGKAIAAHIYGKQLCFADARFPAACARNNQTARGSCRRTLQTFRSSGRTACR